MIAPDIRRCIYIRTRARHFHASASCLCVHYTCVRARNEMATAWASLGGYVGAPKYEYDANSMWNDDHFRVVVDTGVRSAKTSLPFCFAATYVCECLQLQHCLCVVDTQSGCVLHVSAPPRDFTRNVLPATVWVDGQRIDIPAVDAKQSALPLEGGDDKEEGSESDSTEDDVTAKANKYRDALFAGAQWVSSALGRSFSSIDPAAAIASVAHDHVDALPHSIPWSLHNAVQYLPTRHSLEFLTLWSPVADSSTANHPDDDNNNLTVSYFPRPIWRIICAYLLQWDDPILPGKTRDATRYRNDSTADIHRAITKESETARKVHAQRQARFLGTLDPTRDDLVHRCMYGATDVYLLRVALASTQCNVFSDVKFWSMASHGKESTYEGAASRAPFAISDTHYMLQACVVQQNPFFLRYVLAHWNDDDNRNTLSSIWLTAMRNFTFALRIGDVDSAHALTDIIARTYKKQNWAQQCWVHLLPPTILMTEHMCPNCALVFCKYLKFKMTKTIVSKLRSLGRNGHVAMLQNAQDLVDARK